MAGRLYFHRRRSLSCQEATFWRPSTDLAKNGECLLKWSRRATNTDRMPLSCISPLYLSCLERMAPARVPEAGIELPLFGSIHQGVFLSLQHWTGRPLFHSTFHPRTSIFQSVSGQRWKWIRSSRGNTTPFLSWSIAPLSFWRQTTDQKCFLTSTSLRQILGQAHRMGPSKASLLKAKSKVSELD